MRCDLVKFENLFLGKISFEFVSQGWRQILYLHLLFLGRRGHRGDPVYLLILRVSRLPVALPVKEYSVPRDTRLISFDQLSRRPTRGHRCFRSNFSNKIWVTSVRQRPRDSMCNLENKSKINWNGKEEIDDSPLCSKVLMLKPSVGEIVSMGSPLNLLRIVVFPALSRPLQSETKFNEKSQLEIDLWNLQQQDAHFLLLLSHFLENGEKSHFDCLICSEST